MDFDVIRRVGQDWSEGSREEWDKTSRAYSRRAIELESELAEALLACAIFVTKQREPYHGDGRGWDSNPFDVLNVTEGDVELPLAVAGRPEFGSKT